MVIDREIRRRLFPGIGIHELLFLLLLLFTALNSMHCFLILSTRMVVGVTTVAFGKQENLVADIEG